ncbi:hypothetical protein DENSPDRAFT_805863 [Dentipellis sp. KUC8613]|nr:hypothetical protein DENSPDRAFT_805863 [Dentipellis sp. KUC8613]
MAPKPREGSSRASVDRRPKIPHSDELFIDPIPRRNDRSARVGDDEVGGSLSGSASPSTSQPAPSTSETSAVSEDSISAAQTEDALPRDSAQTRSHLNAMVSDELNATDGGYSSEPMPLDSVKAKICGQACGAFVGPMKPSEFLEAFVPPPLALEDGRQRTIPSISFEKISKATNEFEMCSEYIKVCEQLDEDHIMRYYNTHATPDPRADPMEAPLREDTSPGVMTFHKGSLSRAICTTNSFSIAERADELRFKTKADPFDDEPNESKYPFEASSIPGKNTRAQITAYAATMLGLQFRTFVFSVLIVGCRARLIRWDRSGAIATEAFNYQNNPEPLARFLWRYNFLSRAQRGFDESVRLIEATDDTPDLSEARKALKDYMPPKSDLYLLRMIPLALSSSPPNQPVPRPDLSTARPDEPTSLSDVPDLSAKYYHAQESNSSDGWDYYVTAPHTSARGPFGRTTRSLYVYDRLAKRVRHLKDTNRLVSAMHSVEHEVINELGDKKVRHISTVHAAWDVAPEGRCYDTVTPMFCDDGRIDSRCAPPEEGWCQAARVYRPYRLITNELGTPIWKFQNWEEVMRVMIDIFEALDDAEKAGWRHRDVSAGNIMICNGHGLLIDWDASQRSKDMNKMNQERVSELTGTWQFMSLRRVRDIDGRHDAVDDLESVFWVLLWLALNFSVHSLHPDEVEDFLYRIFDQREVIKGRSRGGNGKDALFDKRYLNQFILAPFSPLGLQRALEYLHRTFRVRPPPPLQVDGLEEEDVEMEMSEYQTSLARYNREKERLKDSTHLRKLLQKALDNYDWPPHGPVEHIIPVDHDGSQTKDDSQKAAQHSMSFANEPASSCRAGRAKMMRTGDSGDPRKVTRYATLDERDEERRKTGKGA